MTAPESCSLYLHYVVKDGKLDELLGHLQTILDACAKEEDFVTAVLQRTPERPSELTLFELWRGTREQFAQRQGDKAYRRAYMEASRPLVENVEVRWDTPTQIWGSLEPLR